MSWVTVYCVSDKSSHKCEISRNADKVYSIMYESQGKGMRVFESEMVCNGISLHFATGQIINVKSFCDSSVLRTLFYSSYESFSEYTCKGQSCQLDVPRANFICVVK